MAEQLSSEIAVDAALQPQLRDTLLRIEALFNDLRRERLPVYAQVAGSGDRYAREQACANIEDELQAVESFRLCFRTQQNALRPISRLPPETLSHIFHLYALGDRYEARDVFSTHRTGYLGWITVTHVCSHWQRIACEDRMLWIHVSGDLGGKWINTMQHRAHFAPLIVTIKKYSRKLMTLHLNHIKELHLELKRDEMRSTLPLLQVATASSPCLTALSLKVHWHSREHSMVPASLPCTIFSSAPALRELILLNVSIDFNHPLPLQTKLETFHYAISDFDDADYFAIPHLFSLLLASTTSLKILKFYRAFPKALPLIPQTSSHPDSLVRLPHLEELTLAGATKDCLFVSSILHVSTTYPINIDSSYDAEIESDCPPNPDFVSIASSISRHIQRENSLCAVKKLELRSNSNRPSDTEFLRLAGSRAIGTVQEDNCDFSLQLNMEDFAYNFDHALSQVIEIFRKLPLREVAELSINARDYGYDGWLWVEISNSLPNVTRLSVDIPLYYDDRDLWELLLEGLLSQWQDLNLDMTSDSPARSPSTTSQHLSQFAFPHLTHLTIIAHPKRNRLLSDTDWTEFVDFLYDMLYTRRDGNVGIEELHLLVAGTLPGGITKVCERMKEVVYSVTVAPW